MGKITELVLSLLLTDEEKKAHNLKLDIEKNKAEKMTYLLTP